MWVHAHLEKIIWRGAGWDSGHGLGVLGSSPASGSMLSMEAAWDSLSPFPSAPPHLCTLSLSLSLCLLKKNNYLEYKHWLLNVILLREKTGDFLLFIFKHCGIALKKNECI